MDLRNVTLVNDGAVEFLAGCEAESIKLEHCPAYIRVWIEQVKGRTKTDELDKTIITRRFLT